MNDNFNYGQNPSQSFVNNSPLQQRLNEFNNPQSFAPSQNDIEIIDLDDPRRDIKPTTWHVG